MSTLRDQYKEMSPDRLRDLLSNAVLEPDAKRLCEQVLNEKCGTELKDSDINQNSTSNPLSANGRFGRLSFIAWSTLLTAAFQGFEYGTKQMIHMLGRPETNPTAPYLEIVILSMSFIFLFFFIYAFFVFAIRRCHDINMGGITSGWLILPIANFIFLGFLLLKPGTPDANKYGSPRFTLFWEKALGLIGAIYITMLVLAVTFGLALSVVNPEFRKTIDWLDIIF